MTLTAVSGDNFTLVFGDNSTEVHICPVRAACAVVVRPRGTEAGRAVAVGSVRAPGFGLVAGGSGSADFVGALFAEGAQVDGGPGAERAPGR